jgi:hypothetical protein
VEGDSGDQLRPRTGQVILVGERSFEETGGKAVNAASVLLTTIVNERGFAFDLCPARELMAFADVVVERDVHAAGGHNEVDGEVDDLACSGRLDVVEVRREEICVFGTGTWHDAAAAIEAKDHRCAFEGAEHEREASVGQKVCGGFVAAASAVEVNDGVWVEDAKSGHISRRDVDAACRGSGGIEKNVLALDELAMGWFNGRELLAHNRSLENPLEQGDVRSSSSVLRLCSDMLV